MKGCVFRSLHYIKFFCSTLRVVDRYLLTIPIAALHCGLFVFSPLDLAELCAVLCWQNGICSTPHYEMRDKYTDIQANMFVFNCDMARLYAKRYVFIFNILQLTFYFHFFVCLYHVAYFYVVEFFYV